MFCALRPFAIAIAAGLMPLAACAQATTAPAQASQPIEASKVAAVRVHADWCPNCRALDPKLETVAASQAWDGVSFVRIDYTARNAEAVFAEADTLGIGDALRSHFAAGIKTGQLILIDIASQEVVGVLTHHETPETIADQIRAAQSGA